MQNRITIDPITRIEGHLRIEVHDQGPGIPESLQREIFEELRARSAISTLTPPASSAIRQPPRWSHGISLP